MIKENITKLGKPLFFITLCYNILLESSSMDFQLLKGLIDLTLLIYAGFLWFNYFADFDPLDAFMKLIPPASITILSFQWKEIFKNYLGHDFIFISFNAFNAFSVLIVSLSLFYKYREFKKDQKIVNTSKESYTKMNIIEKVDYEINKNISKSIVDFNRKIKLIKELIDTEHSREKSDSIILEISKNKVLLEKINSLIFQVEDNLSCVSNNNTEDFLVSKSYENYQYIKILIQKQIEDYNCLKQKYLNDFFEDHEKIEDLIKKVIV